MTAPPAGRHPADAAGPDRPGARAGRRGAVPRRPGRSARTSSARSPTSPAASPWCSVGDGRGDARLGHQAAHHDRRALGPRPGGPVHHPRGRRRQGPDRAGRRRRPVPRLQAAPVRLPRARGRPDPGRADRGGAHAAGPDQGAAGLRRLAVLRAVVQPGLARALPARARRLPDHRALGGRGPARGRLRSGRRPVAVRRADLRRAPWSPTASRSSVRRATASPATARELASVQSAPLREIAARILEVSDNEGAEVLSHQVGKAVSGTGSFADGRGRGASRRCRASAYRPTASSSTTAAACPART